LIEGYYRRSNRIIKVSILVVIDQCDENIRIKSLSVMTPIYPHSRGNILGKKEKCLEQRNIFLFKNWKIYEG